MEIGKKSYIWHVICLSQIDPSTKSLNKNIFFCMKHNFCTNVTLKGFKPRFVRPQVMFTPPTWNPYGIIVHPFYLHSNFIEKYWILQTKPTSNENFIMTDKPLQNKIKSLFTEFNINSISLASTVWNNHSDIIIRLESTSCYLTLS